MDEDDFLVTADISSLYTNIENSLTLKYVFQQFQRFLDKNRQDRILLKILQVLLYANDFIFAGKNFLQLMGSSMGLSCSTSLANIFLLHFDNRAMNSFRIKPKNYFRFSDGIFFRFRGSREELLEYEMFLNNLIPNITLSFTQILVKADFLDVSVFKFVSKHKCTLQTNVFFKDTDTHALLYNSSYHPYHTFSSIVFSQLLRFKRLSSFKSDFELSSRISL